MRIKAETSVGLFILVAIIIFLYMTFQIGVLRLDRARYHDYVVYFYDVSGLNKKSDVQIAGVRVGWVEDIELVNNGQQVRASVKILKEYKLYADSYGLIRQDGLLGTKYLEIIPGDPLLSSVKPGGILMKPSKEPVAVDAILTEFQDIARNLHEITNSFKAVLGGDAGTQRLERAVEGFTQATETFTKVTHSMDDMIDRNQYAIDDTLADLRTFSRDLKDEFPHLSRDIRSGIDRVSSQLEKAAEPISCVVDKINRGQGALGKLINDEDVARNVEESIKGLRDYLQVLDRIAIIFDFHVESMYGLGNRIDFRDAKGYFNFRIHPTEDYFYLLGVMGSYTGKVERYQEVRSWKTDSGCELLPTNLSLSAADQLKYATNKDVLIRHLDSYLWNIQLGKVYDDIAFRTGLFESSFGVALDYDIPFDSPLFRWVMTFEAFDFYGRNRIGDTRMHLKWLNKVFFTDTLYFVFGADDFISHTNKNAFFGAGFRFADDDVKYIFGGLGLGR